MSLLDSSEAQVLSNTGRSSWNLAIVSGVWLVFGAVRVVWYFEFQRAVGMMTQLVFDWPMMIAGGALVLVIAVEVIRRRCRALWAFVAVLIVTLMGTAMYTDLPGRVGAMSYLYRNQGHMEQIADSLIAGGEHDPTWRKFHASMDEGPPRRVAFVLDGILDNWAGIILDPSDQVVRINDADAKLDLRDLFGGTMTRATHLWGHWYLCWFT